MGVERQTICRSIFPFLFFRCAVDGTRAIDRPVVRRLAVGEFLVGSEILNQRHRQS